MGHKEKQNSVFQSCCTFRGVVVTNMPDCIPDNLLIVNNSPGGDFPRQQDHPCLSDSL